MLEVPVVRLVPGAALPSFAHREDAGADLVAREETRLAPGGGRALVGTGVCVEVPVGFAGLVLPRSGLALRHGVTCLNAPGLIDPGYRGEVGVILVNTDPEDAYEVRCGDRIAQLVVVQVEQVRFIPALSLSESERGDGGFGHTGR